MHRRSLLSLPLLAAGSGIGAWGALAAGPARAQVRDVFDAINKAGRQRMLSQRMLKSWMAVGQSVLGDQADRILAASIALFERQLAELRAFAPTAELRATYAQLETAWGGFKTQLAGSRPSREAAERLWTQGEQVLALAHRGTGELEALAQRPAGRLVNIAGRQRMLSQRMAALFLSASWGVRPGPSTAELQRARDEFEQAMGVLGAAPETTEPIRSQLALVQTQFIYFDSALRQLRGGTAGERQSRDVFTTSERILEVADQVTGLYARQAT